MPSSCRTSQVTSIENMKLIYRIKHRRLNQIQDWAARAEAANFRPTELARQCGASPRNLRRFLQQQNGKTPQQWLKELLLIKAFSLLIEQQSVKEVALSAATNKPRSSRANSRNTLVF